MFERPYVVLVTGSRFWDNHLLLKATLDQVVQDAINEGYREFVLRHGAHEPPFSKELGRRPWQSADYLAHLWFRRVMRDKPMPVMAVQPRPADWDAPCRPACQKRSRRGQPVDHRQVRSDGSSYCPAAGNYRNIAMVTEDPRPLRGIAFERDNSSGTGHCVRTMREFSIPVLPVPYQPLQETA